MKAIIMRGISGSGKSTEANRIAQELSDQGKSAVIVSADDYFIDDDGEYKFDSRYLDKAHGMCMAQFMAMITEVDAVIVDNTNTQLWEISPYILVAKSAHCYDIEIVRCECDPKVAAARNVHGVPEKGIIAMAGRMEKLLPFWPREKVVRTDKANPFSEEGGYGSPTRYAALHPERITNE